jgi:hypothetical protein
MFFVTVCLLDKNAKRNTYNTLTCWFHATTKCITVIFMNGNSGGNYGGKVPELLQYEYISYLSCQNFKCMFKNKDFSCWPLLPHLFSDTVRPGVFESDRWVVLLCETHHTDKWGYAQWLWKGAYELLKRRYIQNPSNFVWKCVRKCDVSNDISLHHDTTYYTRNANDTGIFLLQWDQILCQLCSCFITLGIALFDNHHFFL